MSKIMSRKANNIYSMILTGHPVGQKELNEIKLEINSIHQDGGSLLYVAVERGSFGLVKKLVTMGANINQDCMNSFPLLAAVYFGNKEIVEYLLLNGADPNHMNSGLTSLFTCILKNNILLFKILLKHGADYKIKAIEGRDSLALSIKLGYDNFVRAIVEKEKLTCKNLEYYMYYLATPQYEGHISILKLFLSKGVNINVKVDDNYTLAHLWVSFGSEKYLKAILDLGADTNVDESEMGTPLNIASYFGNLEAIYLLLNKGADLTRTDPVKNTCLHYAALRGHYKTVKFLIEKEVDICAINMFGETPLHLAALGGDFDTVKIIIDNLEDRRWVNYVEINNPSEFNTSLHYAYENNKKNIINLLISKGADQFIRNKNNQIPKDFNGSENVVNYKKSIIMSIEDIIENFIHNIKIQLKVSNKIDERITVDNLLKLVTDTRNISQLNDLLKDHNEFKEKLYQISKEITENKYAYLL